MARITRDYHQANRDDDHRIEFGIRPSLRQVPPELFRQVAFQVNESFSRPECLHSGCTRLPWSCTYCKKTGCPKCIDKSVCNGDMLYRGSSEGCVYKQIDLFVCYECLEHLRQQFLTQRAALHKARLCDWCKRPLGVTQRLLRRAKCRVCERRGYP